MKCSLIAICLLMIACTRDDTAAKKEVLRQGAIVKMKKVLDQVAADCDANLPKETYKKVQLLKKQVRRHVARK